MTRHGVVPLFFGCGITLTIWGFLACAVLVFYEPLVEHPMPALNVWGNIPRTTVAVPLTKCPTIVFNGCAHRNATLLSPRLFCVGFESDTIRAECNYRRGSWACHHNIGRQFIFTDTIRFNNTAISGSERTVRVQLPEDYVVPYTATVTVERNHLNHVSGKPPGDPDGPILVALVLATIASAFGFVGIMIFIAERQNSAHNFVSIKDRRNTPSPALPTATLPSESPAPKNNQ